MALAVADHLQIVGLVQLRRLLDGGQRERGANFAHAAHRGHTPITRNACLTRGPRDESAGCARADDGEIRRT